MAAAARGWVVAGVVGVAMTVVGASAAAAPAAGAAAPGARTEHGHGPVEVARKVAEAFWSFDWSEATPAASPALRPWVTVALWAELSASPGAPAASTTRVRRHEVDRVMSVTATTADRAPGSVGVAVSAAVVVVEPGRPQAEGREDAELLVVRTGRGWRVARIDL